MSGRCLLHLIARFALLSLLAREVQGISQIWDITKSFHRPDCVEKTVILVNGVFPGPALSVAPGEEIEIIVRNNVPNQVISVHFHGQTQTGTPYMDGANMVSNCPTSPHQSFIYKFTANDQPGTYMYHLHDGADRYAGLYGMLVIKERITDPLYMPELAGEYSMTLSDWYHASVEDIVTGLLSPDFRWPGSPDSLLINGRGQFGCGTGDLAEYCSECPSLESIEVVVGGRYRLRFAAVNAISHYNVAIENHTMTVIEADGYPVKPVDVSSLDISSGQRYSVLITADKPAAAYRISLLSGRRSTYTMLLYNTASVTDPGPPSERQLSVLHPATNDIDFSYAQQEGFASLPGATPLAPPNGNVTKRLVLLTTSELFSDGIQKNGGNPEDHCQSDIDTDKNRWAVNRVTYQTESNTPVTIAAYQGDTKTFTRDRGYIAVKKGDVVDLVFENYPSCRGSSRLGCWTRSWGVDRLCGAACLAQIWQRLPSVS